MNEVENNFENGRKEIWRRQVLFIACIFLFIPFGLLIAVPLEALFGTIGLLISFGFYALGVFVIHQWYSNTPCPKCGKPIMTKSLAVRYRWCTHCGIDLRPKEINYSLSLKPIHYQPGKGAKNVEPGA